MRKFYKARRNKVLAALESCPWKDKITIWEQDAGLHFLVQVDTMVDGEALTKIWAQQGILVQSLDSFYHVAATQKNRSTLVINYSGLDEKELWRFDTLPRHIFEE